MEKIRIVLASFVMLETLDAALTFVGISQSGLFFEKNLFIRNLVSVFGFLPVAAMKIAVAGIFAVLIGYLYGKAKNYRKFLFYLSVLLALVAFYGAGSSAFILLYPW